jgi:N-acetylglucosamine-6-phosphate deacetylase
MKYRIKGVDLIMATVLIKNVRLVGDKEPRSGNILIRNGKIDSIFNDNESSEYTADQEIEGKGQMLIPGMIDVHIHGADGFDMMDGTLQSVEAVSKACARTGCTSFLATSVSSSLEDLLQMISSVSQVIGREPGALIAGIHSEGPYLHVKRKGMQNERYLRHPNMEEMKLILQKSGSLMRMVTLAPELPGGLEMVAYLKERGIIISVAHSDATYEEAKEAFQYGASHVTH